MAQTRITTELQGKVEIQNEIVIPNLIQSVQEHDINRIIKLTFPHQRNQHMYQIKI